MGGGAGRGRGGGHPPKMAVPPWGTGRNWRAHQQKGDRSAHHVDGTAACLGHPPAADGVRRPPPPSPLPPPGAGLTGKGWVTRGGQSPTTSSFPSPPPRPASSRHLTLGNAYAPHLHPRTRAGCPLSGADTPRPRTASSSAGPPPVRHRVPLDKDGGRVGAAHWGGVAGGTQEGRVRAPSAGRGRRPSARLAAAAAGRRVRSPVARVRDRHTRRWGGRGRGGGGDARRTERLDGVGAGRRAQRRRATAAICAPL